MPIYKYISGQAVRRVEHLPFLPFALPDLDDAELSEIRSVVDSGWITTGPKTHQFEMKFAAALGVKHAIAVNSCTAAMHLGLDAIGIRPGDEVVTTPYTFAATAEVIRYCGARPAFVDVDPVTLNIDPALIEHAITPRTKLILPVHIGGFPAEMEAIRETADHHGLPVMDDAAHAFTTTYHNQKIGTVGDLTCFSFYATKTITTGEGGMITTNNDAWAERCRIMSLHGISKDAWKRYSAEGDWYYEIVAPGYKYNMTDVAAAMGLAQLRKADRMRARRTEIADLYNEIFADVPQLQIPHDDAAMRHAWHLYMLRLNLDTLTIDRKAFASELKERGIGVSVHFIPLHMHPYYRETYGYKAEDFPVAHREYLREISLPIYSKMTDRDAHRVIEAVLDIVSIFAK